MSNIQNLFGKGTKKTANFLMKIEVLELPKLPNKKAHGITASISAFFRQS